MTPAAPAPDFRTRDGAAIYLVAACGYSDLLRAAAGEYDLKPGDIVISTSDQPRLDRLRVTFRPCVQCGVPKLGAGFEFSPDDPTAPLPEPYQRYNRCRDCYRPRKTTWVQEALAAARGGAK